MTGSEDGGASPFKQSLGGAPGAGSILSGGALDALGQRYLEIDSTGKMYAISLAWDTAAQSYSGIPDIIDLSY